MKVAIRFLDVSFSYEQVSVLDKASFHVHEGEFAAIVGQNGSGKTTVLKLIMGLERPSGGQVEVLGGSAYAARPHVGYVPQLPAYDPSFPVSVRDVVRMGVLHGLTEKRGARATVDRALERADVSDLADRPYGALSGGQRRRVLVARALASEPRLLVLDEPTANMDAASENRLYKVLGELKGSTTIVVVTHDTGFVSDLTDAVLCVGDRAGTGRSIVRHTAEPAEHAPPELYGGKAKRVLHDVSVPDPGRCKECSE